jgi:hypothetical protein
MSYCSNNLAKKPRSLKLNQTWFKQKGAALIFMAFVLGLGAAVYVLKTFNSDNVKAQQDEKTSQTLKEAKVALIAWAVNHPNTPGMMPYPDRNGDVEGYDGKSDCYTGTFQYSLLLGQLPIAGQTNPCVLPQTGLGGDWRDAQGNRLWYAVSRNLVHDYEHSESPIINSGMSNPPLFGVTPYLRQGGTQSYPWLKVLDRNGNLISDRVVAVIIAPGSPIGSQNRSAAAPNANEFLDSFQIGAAVFNNSNYTSPNEEFVVGESSQNVLDSDTTFVKPYSFNDKLVYITIEELMAAVERRVGEQVRSSLKTYLDANGYYPYAAQLGTTANFACELTTAAGTAGLTNGFVPVDNQSCTYTRSSPNTSLTCSQSIFDASTSGVTSIRFDRTSGGTFSTANSGLCTRNSTTRCTCTGAGTCGASASRVTCTSTSCSSTGMMGSYRLTSGKFRQRSAGCSQTTFPTKTAVGCSNSNSVITCNTINGDFSSCGNVAFGALLPSWFKANVWQGYVYYQMTNPATPAISVGNKITDAMVATVGRPIDTAPFALSKTPVTAAQVQPSCNLLNNYLDSVENADGNNLYDATSTQRNAGYNDQTFVVTP